MHHLARPARNLFAATRDWREPQPREPCRDIHRIDDRKVMRVLRSPGLHASVCRMTWVIKVLIDQHNASARP